MRLLFKLRIPFFSQQSDLLQIVSMRRKALSPYTFNDGMHIPSGNWVCAPSRAIMQDPAHYTNPTEFDGYRFMGKTSTEETTKLGADASRFTDTEPKFLFWSHGKRAW